VTIEADGVGRYSQDTEAALYFCILEALQNIQKYAKATSAVVRLREDGDRLSVEVADDGRGFDVAATRRGNGLTNMEDRLDALGGTLQIVSSPGGGTTLRAIIPLTPTVPVRS
jgi:signal transduction histidine kinase